MKDGLHATAFPSGISGVPAEVIEQLTPIVLRKRELRADSAGPGKFRGGCGQTLQVAVRTNETYRFAPLFDRLHHAAAGYAGGRDGSFAEIVLSSGERYESKGTRELDSTTEITLQLPGGGGFFEPFEREPELVAIDVANGIVSRAAAAIDYGVVLDDALRVDADSTTKRRAGATA